MRKLLLPIFSLCFAASFAQKPILTCHDLVPGPESSFPRDLFGANGILFFTADSPEKGRELWKYDKVSGKPEMVKDINEGKGNSSVYGYVAMDNKLYFGAVSDSFGEELWVTDGSAAGTEIVKDIWPGKKGYGATSEKIALNGKLLFIGNDSIHGKELWITDGTEAGTTLVKDINPGPAESQIRNFTLDQNKIYFTAVEPSTGFELWVTDGTEAGTSRVTDLNPGAKHSTVGRLWRGGSGDLYFGGGISSTGTELCKTDGTATGTQVVKDIWPGGESGCYHTAELVEYKGRLYFNADDSVHGRELWVTDGTEQGTHIVRDIYPGTWPGGGSDPQFLTVYKNKLYFKANGGGIGDELWESDGTAQGTRLYEDIRQGTDASSPFYLTVYNNYLYFVASPGNSQRRVMRTDGINPVEIVTPQLNVMGGLYLFDSALYFNANDTTHGYELWSLRDTNNYTGIKNVGMSPDEPAKIYPNPNDGNFVIESPENGRLQISNMQGQVVHEQAVIKGGNAVELPVRVRGVYMVQVINKEGAKTMKKIILE